MVKTTVRIIVQFLIFQALAKDAYDHYTAIYHLLLERLKQHRSSFPPENRIDTRTRRPSTIAEQAMLHRVPNIQQGTTHMPGLQRSPLVNIKQGTSYYNNSHTTDCVAPPNGNNQYQSFTDTDIQVPPMNLSGCIQDVLPHPYVKPHIPHSHMITTSIDEGVEADIMESEANFEKGDNSEHFVKDGFGMGLIPSCAYGDLSQLTKPHNNSSSSMGPSPFTSFDSSLEPDFVSSPTSCSQFGTSVGGIPSAGVNSSGNGASQEGNAPEESSECTDEERVQDRSQTRSPVNFREGRRASDGLVAQGIIAFRQRLAGAQGMTELRQEHSILQQMYQQNMTAEAIQAVQKQHAEYIEKTNQQWSQEENCQTTTASVCQKNEFTLGKL